MNNIPTQYRYRSHSNDPNIYGALNTRSVNSMTINVSGSSNTNVGNVSNSYNNIFNGISEENTQVQAWLSPLEAHRRHQDVRTRRLDGIGEWVLERTEFRYWRRSRGSLANRTLLCYGGQGVGKTYISSLVIDSLCNLVRGQDAAVFCLYCDYQAQKEQSPVNIIGGLLRQIVARVAELPDGIRRVFEESRKNLGGRGLRLPEMLKLFGEALTPFGQVFICIDAIDELQAKDRLELLRAFRQIIRGAPNTRLFLTARSYIRGELDKNLTEGAYIIPIVTDKGDICRYVNSKMDEDLDPELMSDDLKKAIMEMMLEKTSEMFLLVSLGIDAILGETTISRRKKMLEKVAKTGVALDDAYTETLQRIREQKGGRSRLGMEVLMWISHSERPLRIDELCHALAVETESTDLDPGNIPLVTTILGSCLGLVIFEKEASTLRLNHYTLQEYLSGHGIFPGAHLALAETCLTYLSLQMVEKISTVLDTAPPTMPFLEYASFYWGKHAQGEITGRVRSLVLKLLHQSNKHMSTKLLFMGDNFSSEDLGSRYRPGGFTGLHCLAYHGTTEIAIALRAMEIWEVNSNDFTGSTPLIWAAKRGHVEMVGLLLSQRNIAPDLADERGHTALSWAAVRGHVGVVKQLLKREDVNTNSVTNTGQTPLFLAASEGHRAVVELLLDQEDVDPNVADGIRGRAPISLAASRGYEEVVKLLLSRKDVEPDKKDRRGRTPLLWAAFTGHQEVVGLLLDRKDVDPSVEEESGRTASALAALGGREGVMNLLRLYKQ